MRRYIYSPYICKSLFLYESLPSLFLFQPLYFSLHTSIVSVLWFSLHKTLFLRWTHHFPSSSQLDSSVRRGFCDPPQSASLHSPSCTLLCFSSWHTPALEILQVNLYIGWSSVCSSVEQKVWEEPFYWSIISNQYRLCSERTSECMDEWIHNFFPLFFRNQ